MLSWRRVTLDVKVSIWTYNVPQQTHWTRLFCSLCSVDDGSVLALTTRTVWAGVTKRRRDNTRLPPDLARFSVFGPHLDTNTPCSTVRWAELSLFLNQLPLFGRLSSCVRGVISPPKLQALVYDILPPRRKMLESDARSLLSAFALVSFWGALVRLTGR